MGFLVKTRMIMTAATAALLIGPFATVASAHAAQIPHDTTTYNPAPTATVQPLDCHGTTGAYGCGPGYVWNGNRCVPC